VRLHYRTLGKPQKDRRANDKCGSDHAWDNRQRRTIYSPELPVSCLGKDHVDATKFFIVLPDEMATAIEQPSDEHAREIPALRLLDIGGEYRLLTEGLGVNHARLVMGTSMGGMHTWLMGRAASRFHGCAYAAGELPTQIRTQPRWRRMVIRAIRNDPSWDGGEYPAVPESHPACAPLRDAFGS